MADPAVRVVVRAVRGFTETIVKKITLDVTANLIEDTPRDTGWARSNWVPTIGMPPAEEALVGSPEQVNTSVQQSGIAKVATGYRLIQGAIFISNNVPYIGRLNDGSSKQAPSGFVQAAILRAVRQNLAFTP